MQSQSDSVYADVRYLAERWRHEERLPRIFDGPSRRSNTELRTVEIKDARASAQQKLIDRNGFELMNFDSPIQDFTDRQSIEKSYFPAVSQLVKVHTGASEVFVTNHLIRTEDKSDFNKAYARFVHCDYDSKNARQKSLQQLKAKGRDSQDYESAEFAWYNTWQPFDYSVYHNPLAVLDAQSIKSGDISSYLYAGNGKDFESSIPLFNSSHQFYYYKEMKTDELLLLKQLDTREGRALVAPHTSFVDPTSIESNPPRRSIEVRWMAVFRDEKSK